VPSVLSFTIFNVELVLGTYFGSDPKLFSNLHLWLGIEQVRVDNFLPGVDNFLDELTEAFRGLI
jgi:hypothetical protein